MAGGITDIAKFAAGTPLALNAPLVAASPLSLLTSISNPITTGLQVLSGIFGGSKVKVSGAASNGQAASGFANFANDDVISGGGRLVDFSDVKSVAIAGVVLVGAIYAYKKLKR